MRKTLYTVNLNWCDKFSDPKVITEGWDYYYFTNDRSFKSKIWKVIYIDEIDIKTARRIKITNPFRDHDWSIWVDSSMTINCNLDQFIDKYVKADFNLLKHPDRNCIYDEALACLKYNKDDSRIINDQIAAYRTVSYPSNNGMVATGVIVRKKSEEINKFCNRWWVEVEKYSKRDQLSFNYIQHLLPTTYHTIPFEVLKSEFILNKHIK